MKKQLLLTICAILFGFATSIASNSTNGKNLNTTFFTHTNPIKNTDPVKNPKAKAKTTKAKTANTLTASFTIEYLVIGGGGAGGAGISEESGGGGGGAGGLLEGTIASTNWATAKTITIGAGGANGPEAKSGENSVFGTITALGGGRGGNSNYYAENGGSGGGGAFRAIGSLSVAA